MPSESCWLSARTSLPPAIRWLGREGLQRGRGKPRSFASLHFIHLTFNTLKSFWLPATWRNSVSLLILFSWIYFKQTKQNAESTESSTQCSTSAERQNGAARPRVCGVGRHVPRRHPQSKQCSSRMTFWMSFMFMENMKLLFCQNEMIMASSASKRSWHAWWKVPPNSNLEGKLPISGPGDTWSTWQVMMLGWVELKSN